MADRLRILHIGKYFPPFAGGMENYLRDLMVAQARRGTDTRALVHQSDLTLRSRDELYPAGGQELPVTRAAVWARLLFTPLGPTFPFLFNRLLKRQKPDIVHLHMPNVSAFWTLLLPRARRIPWVVHWHSDVLSSRQGIGLRLFHILYRPLERAMLNRCAAVIVTSPPYLESSLPLRGFHDKCRVVPLGLGPSTGPAAPTLRPAGGHAGPLRVLAIGRLTYYKGFEYLVRAVAAAGEVELHLVGKGEQAEMLQTLARELHLENRVTFHGHLPDDQLATQLAACDCLCLPSIERTEAFGMVLLEAMRAGKATIASAVPGSGMGWVVDNHTTGLHVSPESTGELAASMRLLQEDRDKMRLLGEQGRHKFDLQFHIEKSTERIDEVYRDALKHTPTHKQMQGST